MNSPDSHTQLPATTVDIRLSRSDVVVIRNALTELCNGPYFPVGDSELATITGYERAEFQHALDSVNQVLSATLTERPDCELLVEISPDGQDLTLRPTEDALKLFAVTLGHIGMVRGWNYLRERGDSFDGSPQVSQVEAVANFESRIGASSEEAQALGQRLRRMISAT